MRRRKVQFLAYGRLWSSVLAVITVLLVAPQGAAAEREIYNAEVAGMHVRVWLDEPMKMQMLMRGKWMTFRPRAGELTHHFGIDLTDPKTGGTIPTAVVRVRLRDRRSGAQTTKNLPEMFGGTLVYGTNLKLEKGNYDAVVTIAPLTIMRMGPSIDKWRSPVEVKFAFKVE